MQQSNRTLLGMLTWLTLWFSHTTSAAPEIPGESLHGPLAFVGATVHPISGPTVENATVVISRKGRIQAVGREIVIPPQAKQLNLVGKHVYPGLLDAHSNIGLVEINRVRASVDSAETGNINPNTKSWVAVNPDSEMIPVTRSNGVLLALSAPSGGLISGKSAVMQLDGWTFEDMTLRSSIGMHVQWPNMLPVINWTTEETASEQIEERDEQLEILRQTFERARAYQQARTADRANSVFDIRWEAMIPVLEQKIPLIVSANDVQQIQSAVGFSTKQNVRLIIYGGYDALQCAELLKKHDIPVIIAGIYRLPRRRHDNYDAPFALPAKLQSAGISFCISSAGRFGASNLRNLPYHAATASAFGLPKEAALKAITLSPAEILGVADRVGSIEKGKDATLIITDGDILETPTHVEAAFIQGREVELNDRHKRLWRKYQEKYRRLGIGN
ncbi:MAG: amidohydrolase family protein [Pirellulaceae bacterium]|nr:amidohydrolase family protein [Pirellulaceae bacterium]